MIKRESNTENKDKKIKKKQGKEEQGLENKKT